MNKKRVIIASSIVVLMISIYLAFYLADVIKIMDNTAYQSGEYMAYLTVEDLVENVDFVYEGIVTGYHYEVIDLKDGSKFVRNKATQGSLGVLCTIYDIDIIEQYKGETIKKASIKIEGGILGDRDFEQALLVKNAGLSVRTISGKAMEVGENYLFLVSGNVGSMIRGNTTAHYVPNPTQFKYNQSDCWGTDRINYDVIKDYLKSEEYICPNKVNAEYLEDDSPKYESVKEMVDNSDYIFEGYIRNINYIVQDSQFYTEYRIVTTDVYLGASSSRLYVLGGNDEYQVEEQYRVLNRRGMTVRNVIRGANVLKLGKTYLFIVKRGSKENSGIVANPTQFAFATDDSNAPGGVTYSMIMEYLNKNK